MKTIQRAIDVLNCFSHAEPELSVGELSERLRVHKSIVSRVVSTLCANRMLQQDPVTRRVSIGIGAFSLGALFIRRFPLEQIATAHLKALAETVQQSCHVAVLDGHRLLTIASAETRKNLRVILRPGEHRFLHATAGGKIILASTPGLLEQLAETTGLPVVTSKTITSVAKLRKELAIIRRDGIAWNWEESTRGAGACAAPIYDANGTIVATVTAVYPLSAVDREEFARIEAGIRAAGRVISTAIARHADRSATSTQTSTRTRRRRLAAVPTERDT